MQRYKKIWKYANNLVSLYAELCELCKSGAENILFCV